MGTALKGKPIPRRKVAARGAVARLTPAIEPEWPRASTQRVTGGKVGVGRHPVLTASERMSRMNKTPEARIRAGDKLRRLNADPAFRARQGYLTDEQRQMILAEIVVGRDYIDIGVDWLVCSSKIAKIARSAGIHRCPRKLTREKVRAIIGHISAGRKTGDIAREFNVNTTTISHIKHGRGWPSVARMEQK